LHKYVEGKQGRGAWGQTECKQTKRENPHLKEQGKENGTKGGHRGRRGGAPRTLKNKRQDKKKKKKKNNCGRGALIYVGFRRREVIPRKGKLRVGT